MFLSVVTFRFRTSDIVAEEKNYFGHHVALAKAMPGLRLYLTGKLRATRKLTPERYRAGIIGFDDAAAAAAGMRDSAMALMADTREHMTQLHSHNADVDVIVPFPTGADKPCFTVVASFQARDVERYREQHVALARRLPGLRGYATGSGIALLGFDSYDDMRAAYRTEVGAQVLKSGNEHLADLRVTYVDARTEV